jgi:hypothetical protein
MHAAIMVAPGLDRHWGHTPWSHASRGSLEVIYLRGRYFWTKFRWKGRLVRESTRSEDFETATECEKLLRRRLALEYVRDLKLNPARYPKCPSFLDAQTAKMEKAADAYFRQGSKERK